MRQRLILFACICALALSTCENDQVIALLKMPSQLSWLNITAYAGGLQLEGGASLEPGFEPSVLEYTVYVAKDTDSFNVDAGITGGTVTATSVKDQITGTDFWLDDEPVELILTVEREYMETGEYKLTVVKIDMVPPAKDIKISLTPEIGTFFIGRGVLPVINVTASLPEAGGELSYQWYMNTDNNTRTGYLISGATGNSYTMLDAETKTVRTVYYYAEIINTINGKQGVTKSAPCAVTFINKYELDPKSLNMVDVPAGTVDPSIHDWNDSLPDEEWSTSGFLMGENLVTYELWDRVRHYADAGGYRFTQSGNQGATRAASGMDLITGVYYSTPSTLENPQPIGNKLNPVTLIGWRSAVVWCNAFSEMDNFEPVYVDSDGNVLRDSRVPIELLIDKTKIAGKNGYRLPTPEEWLYAARGANPSLSAPWTDRFPGTDNGDYLYQYMGVSSDKCVGSYGEKHTIEVGSLKPNTIGLYDMLGMVLQWVWWEDPDTITGFREDQTSSAGYSIQSFYLRGLDNRYVFTVFSVFNGPVNISGDDFYGFRIVRNKE